MGGGAAAGLGNTAFYTTDAANLATPYYNTPQSDQRMHEGLRVALPGEMAGGEVLFSPAALTRRLILPAARGHGRRCRRCCSWWSVAQRRAGHLCSRTRWRCCAVRMWGRRKTQGPGWDLVSAARCWWTAARNAAACRHADLGGVCGHSWFLIHSAAERGDTDQHRLRACVPLSATIRDAVMRRCGDK